MRLLPIASTVLFVGLAAPLAVADVPASQVRIDDQADLLSDAEEAELAEATAQVTLPATVTDVDFLTFASNDENLNDTVRFYAGSHGMQDSEGEKYADGHLIVAIGMDPRGMGVYAGEDVADDLNLRSDERIAGVVDAMRPLLQDEKWKDGMLRGVQAAADTDLVSESSGGSSNAGLVGGILAGGAGILGVGGVAVAVVVGRKSKTKQAREDYEFILAHHGDMAQRLDEIDVRAHSLSSPLANDSLRKEWKDIQENFLAAHEEVTRLGSLSTSSSDKEFREHAGELSTARAAVEAAINAETNLEQLARMEHGDPEARRQELTTLHSDVLEAVTQSEGELNEQLTALDERVLELREKLDAPEFMDSFAAILADYRVLIDELTDRLYAKSQAERSEDHRVGGLGSAAWHPGVGTYYVPFYTTNAWYQADVESAQAASSSSVNTGYSSGGFSGAGGSGKF
ncbi:DUF5129 domain-containing protein [Corynebacterium flavescens]|uniref:DUF5129 domain-containing protein n=1 Tax=Corynebacterium flavescens TaxID=28028 RepID=UPI003FD04D8C